MRVLNVGGGADRSVPRIFKGWDQDLLDIDPAVNPDIVCDARDMTKVRTKYDAVYCSHTLEHFYKHDVPRVLGNWANVLKPLGFAHIAVPDLLCLMECVVKGNRDIEETWYVSPSGAISFHDVLYGFGRPMSQGNLYYAHKCGFTEKSLSKALRAAGFKTAMTATDGGSIIAFGFKSKPSKAQLIQLGI